MDFQTANPLLQAQHLSVDLNWNLEWKNSWPVYAGFSRERDFHCHCGILNRLLPQDSHKLWKYLSAPNVVQEFLFSGFYKLSVSIFTEQQEVDLFTGTNKAGEHFFQMLALSIHLTKWNISAVPIRDKNAGLWSTCLQGFWVSPWGHFLQSGLFGVVYFLNL